MTEDAAEKATWPWWYSSDEERYHGPLYSRADAIMEAWGQDERRPVHIMQAVHASLNTELFDADDVAQKFDEANEEVQDPDGDYFSSQVKSERWQKLADELNARVKAFVRDEGLKAWMFNTRTKGEWVDLSEGALLTLPYAAREILAELAMAFQSGTTYADYVDGQMASLRLALAPPVEAAPAS